MATVFLVFLLAHLGAAYEPSPSWQGYGKTYAVLRSQRKMDFDTSRALCAAVGGHLPEPRSLEDTNNLARMLDTNIFLGMRDKVEGQWRWDSDGSLVSWTNWENWQSDPDCGRQPEPNGNRTENCAMVLKNSYNSSNIFDNRETWGDTGCDRIVKNIVCEQSGCSNKMRQCYFDNALYNINAPYVTHLCAVKRFIDRCLDETECDSSEEQQKQSRFFKRLNTEICNLTVHWQYWEASTNKTCKNDKDMEVDTMKELMNCKKHFNSTYLIPECSKVNLAYNCMVIDVSAACGSGIYREYMKELMRATIRAMNATTHHFYTEPPYNCNVTIP